MFIVSELTFGTGRCFGNALTIRAGNVEMCVYSGKKRRKDTSSISQTGKYQSGAEMSRKCLRHNDRKMSVMNKGINRVVVACNETTFLSQTGASIQTK